MSSDHLTRVLAALPDAALFEAVRETVFHLALAPPGDDRDREQCRGHYAASWFAAVETGRVDLWHRAAAEGQQLARDHDADNFQRAQEFRRGMASEPV